MQIIKTFKPYQGKSEQLLGPQPLSEGNEYIGIIVEPCWEAPIPPEKSWLFPVFHPTLVVKYNAFATHPESGVRVALLKDGVYYQFSAEDWQPVEEPVFYSPLQIRETIEHWCGPLEIEVEWTDCFESLDIGYIVNVDLEDWILQFGIAELLNFPVQLTEITYCNDGIHLLLPSNIEAARISDTIAQPLDGKCYQGDLDALCQTVTLSTPIPNGPVQLHFKVQPKIDYVDREHQVSELPCVTVERMQQVNRRANNWDYWALSNNSCGVVADINYHQYDLLIQITAIANQIKEARAIANQYIAHIEEVGYIKAEPFGLKFNIITVGNLRENSFEEQEAYLPSASFTIKIFNLNRGN